MWVSVVALFLALPAAAEFYRYTDAKGQVHFVEDPSHIPESQLGTLRVYQEEKDQLSDSEKRRRLNEARRREEAPAATPDRGALNGISPSDHSALETPVIINGHQVLVPVTIGYRGRQVKTHLLLDTGASFTILHRKAARQIMLTGTENREATVVGGSRIPVRMAKVDYILVGPYRIRGVQVAIIRDESPGQGHQGLLGMNILRNFDYTLDMDRRVIVWNR